MAQTLVRFPPKARALTLGLAADVINQANELGPGHWGLTYYDDWAIRINVGWTEIFTATRHSLRLIVDYDLARSIQLPSNANLDPGEDPRGYYRTIPGSAALELSYDPPASFSKTIQSIKPALYQAIVFAGRRRVGRGVKAGHNQWAVEQIAKALRTALPAPGYESTRAARAGSTEQALNLMEGALKRVVTSRFERKPALRRACVAHYGSLCAVCGFSFERTFGPIGRGFIHVHHLVPLHSTGAASVDAIKDLRPVCPNCHAMLHRDDPPLAIAQLQTMIRDEAAV